MMLLNERNIFEIPLIEKLIILMCFLGRISLALS